MKNLVIVTNLVTLLQLFLSLTSGVFLNYFIENLRQHLKILEEEDDVMEEILFRQRASAIICLFLLFLF